jgi:hypothetical protein
VVATTNGKLLFAFLAYAALCWRKNDSFFADVLLLGSRLAQQTITI